MSNSIFNVFEESDNHPTQLAPAKNQPAFNRSHLAGPLRGKLAGGDRIQSQKRALGDLGNKITIQQPASSAKNNLTKFEATSQIGNSFKDCGNLNTPNNKPSVSTIHKSATKSQPSRLLSRNDAVFSNVTNTPKCKGSGTFLNKQTSDDIKELVLATPEISIQPCIDYSHEPEIFPEDSCDAFEDDVIPEHKHLSNEDFDKLVEYMRSSFRLTPVPLVEPFDIEPTCIEDEKLFKIPADAEIVSPLNATDFYMPEIPDVNELLLEVV